MAFKEEKMSSTIIKIIIMILLLVFLILTMMFVLGNAKYSERLSGSATAKVATMICEMNVLPNGGNNNVAINPYCDVTVVDYSNNTTTESSVDFTIEVKPKDNAYVLPEFEWRNSSGTVIASSEDVLDNNNQVIARTATFPTQSFTAGIAESKLFKIIFYNTGIDDMSKLVDFELHVNQSISEE